MQAGADYEGYLLGTSFARPILAKRVVEIARAEGADAVCHGSTGKGNDQVRFELAIMHFAPDLKIITPWREWDIQSRDEEIDYAEAHHIPLKISRETNYSKDKNLWHLSHEGLDLEDPGNEPQYDKAGFLELGVSPKTAPDKSEFVELEFEKGAPVALNGEKLKSAAIIAKLNEIGGRNGVGLYDVVENRLVGMKSRGVYETPGGTILYKAHEVLETLTLDKLTAHKKRELAITFGELIFNMLILVGSIKMADRIVHEPDSGRISRGFQIRSFRAEKSGCVAVENTIVVWYRLHNSFTACSVTEVKSAGRLCASSNSTTLFAMLWSLRQAAGRSENSDSKKRTDVVIITGALHLAASSHASSGRSLWLWSIRTSGMIFE